jgi:hypothetical protein
MRHKVTPFNFALLLLSMSGPLLHAQNASSARATAGRAATIPALAMVRSVADAEAEGLAHGVGAPQLDSVRLRILAEQADGAGSADRRCVDTSQAGSGSLRAGDFVLGASVNKLTSARQNKIWWVALHEPSERGTGLLLRATRLDRTAALSAADTLRVTRLGYAYSGGISDQTFFPSWIDFPAAGRWLIVATAGVDWGCVIVDVAVM